jgi:DNA-directed RNA polymerase III subunit RPC7
MYGQSQANAQYGIKNKASVDPFNAVPTYSQRYIRQERALPDWSRRPICRELFPTELHDTVASDSGATGDGARKRRRLELSKVSALPSAEEAFGIYAGGDEFAEDGEASTANRGRDALEKLDRMRDDEGDEAQDPEDDEGGNEEDEDEAYDDEDAGDYDAENYFETGSDFGDDYGDADDGEGTF